MSYLFSSRNIDSTFFITMSDIVGFSLTIASKLAGWDAVLGVVSSSFSSSDEDDDDDDVEWLTCVDNDDEDWPATGVDSPKSLGSGRTFADIFTWLSVLAEEAPSSQSVHWRLAGILPTMKRQLTLSTSLVQDVHPLAHELPLNWSQPWFVRSKLICVQCQKPR